MPYPKSIELAKILASSLNSSSEFVLLEEGPVMHFIYAKINYYVYLKCVTYAGNPYPENTTRAQLPKRQEFEKIKYSEARFLFLGYDVNNKVFVCWDPIKAKNRLNRKNYVSFFSRKSLQDNAEYGIIKINQLTNGDQFVIFKADDSILFFNTIDNYFLFDNSETTNILMDKKELDILQNVEDDVSVKLLIDELRSANSSRMNIISECMNSFGRFYKKMGFNAWKNVIYTYIDKIDSMPVNDFTDIYNEQSSIEKSKQSSADETNSKEEIEHLANSKDNLIPQDDIFQLKSNTLTALGHFTDNGFTIIEGSEAEIYCARSLRNHEKREELLNIYAHKSDKCWILNNDINFNTPSAAAEFCFGRSSNGWLEWVDQNNIPLKDLYASLRESISSNENDSQESNKGVIKLSNELDYDIFESSRLNESPKTHQEEITLKDNKQTIIPTNESKIIKKDNYLIDSLTDNDKQIFLFSKSIDKSLITRGFTLQKSSYNDIHKIIGRNLRRGESIKVKVQIVDHNYTCRLNHIHFSHSNSDCYQIYWINKILIHQFLNNYLTNYNCDYFDVYGIIGESKFILIPKKNNGELAVKREKTDSKIDVIQYGKLFNENNEEKPSRKDFLDYLSNIIRKDGKPYREKTIKRFKDSINDHTLKLYIARLFNKTNLLEITDILEVESLRKTFNKSNYAQLLERNYPSEMLWHYIEFLKKSPYILSRNKNDKESKTDNSNKEDNPSYSKVIDNSNSLGEKIFLLNKLIDKTFLLNGFALPVSTRSAMIHITGEEIEKGNHSIINAIIEDKSNNEIVFPVKLHRSITKRDVYQILWDKSSGILEFIKTEIYPYSKFIDVYYFLNKSAIYIKPLFTDEVRDDVNRQKESEHSKTALNNNAGNTSEIKKANIWAAFKSNNFRNIYKEKLISKIPKHLVDERMRIFNIVVNEADKGSLGKLLKECSDFDKMYYYLNRFFLFDGKKYTNFAWLEEQFFDYLNCFKKYFEKNGNITDATIIPQKASSMIKLIYNNGTSEELMPQDALRKVVKLVGHENALKMNLKVRNENMLERYRIGTDNKYEKISEWCWLSTRGDARIKFKNIQSMLQKYDSLGIKANLIE